MMNASFHSGSETSIFTGVAPAARTRSTAAIRSGTLNVMWCGPLPRRATNRPRKLFRSVSHGSSNSTDIPSPAASPIQTCIGRNPIDCPPNSTVPPSVPVRNRSAGAVSRAAIATWSSWYKALLRCGLAAGSREDAGAHVTDAEHGETTDRVEEVVVRGEHDHGDRKQRVERGENSRPSILQARREDERAPSRPGAVHTRHCRELIRDVLHAAGVERP